ncbi:hypothetical protein XsacCFBP4641_15405 [Xanthomonas sacchari]|uniref:Uncharacterized protein n=1 Tax=Xanthomonas sacchari TaxID=56458 RepID=A0A2P5Z1E2_9XANT|nr:hypothetical protein XsacCFBP4641_15405 [Xanthomonas sacchari]
MKILDVRVQGAMLDVLDQREGLEQQRDHVPGQAPAWIMTTRGTHSTPTTPSPGGIAFRDSVCMQPAMRDVAT